MKDLRTQLRTLIDELNRELERPDDSLGELNKQYDMGRRMGQRQVIQRLEALLGTPAYTHTRKRGT